MSRRKLRGHAVPPVDHEEVGSKVDSMAAMAVTIERPIKE